MIEVTQAQRERLALLAEEMGETIQIIGKILRHGFNSTHPDGGPTNAELLEKELGHVLAAADILDGCGDIDGGNVHRFSRVKMDNVGEYLHYHVKNESVLACKYREVK